MRAAGSVCARLKCAAGVELLCGCRRRCCLHAPRLHKGYEWGLEQLSTCRRTSAYVLLG